MESRNLKAAIGEFQLLQLKQITRGLRAGRVMEGRCLVEPVVPHTKMDDVKLAGLYLPQGSEEALRPPATTGIVLACGDGAPEGIFEGVMVLFGRYAGSRNLIDEREYIILDYKEIMCTLVSKDEDLSDIIVPVLPDKDTGVPVEANKLIPG